MASKQLPISLAEITERLRALGQLEQLSKDELQEFANLYWEKESRLYSLDQATKRIGSTGEQIHAESELRDRRGPEGQRR